MVEDTPVEISCSMVRLKSDGVVVVFNSPVILALYVIGESSVIVG